MPSLPPPTLPRALLAHTLPSSSVQEAAENRSGSHAKYGLVGGLFPPPVRHTQAP